VGPSLRNGTRWGPDRRSLGREARAGLWVIALLAATLLAWIAGWGWIAVVTGPAVLGIAARVAGVDSRRPGDWTRPGRA
jgi:hypothetical protein